MKMKNIAKRISVLLALVFVVSSMIVPASAYDLSNYNQTEDGYEMDESHGNNVDVYIYVFVQDNMIYLTNRGDYKFGYYSDDLPPEFDGYAQFYRSFMFQGCDPDETLENGEIFKIRMTLEPGTYCFTYPDGRHNTNIVALTQDFNTPFVGDGYYTAEDVRDENVEMVTLEKDDILPIFIMYGDENWRNSRAAQYEFKNYAKSIAEAYEIRATAARESVLAEAPEEEVEEEKPSFTPADGPTRVTSDVIVTEEIPPEEKKIPWALIIAGAGLTAGFIAYVIIKKKLQSMLDGDDD